MEQCQEDFSEADFRPATEGRYKTHVENHVFCFFKCVPCSVFASGDPSSFELDFLESLGTDVDPVSSVGYHESVSS